VHCCSGHLRRGGDGNSGGSTLAGVHDEFFESLAGFLEVSFSISDAASGYFHQLQRQGDGLIAGVCVGFVHAGRLAGLGVLARRNHPSKKYGHTGMNRTVRISKLGLCQVP